MSPVFGSPEIYAMVSFGHKEKEGEKESNYFVFAYAGMVDAAALLDSASRVEWHGPNTWNPEAEANAIHTLTQRSVAGMLVSAANRNALNPAINEAIQTGIPIITFDADALESERLTFVGTNNYQAGYLAGKTMAEWLQGNGAVAISTIKNAAHLNERLTGFQAALSEHAPQTALHIMYSRHAILIQEDGRTDYHEAYQNYTTMLQAYPDIRGIFTPFGSQGNGAAKAVDELRLQYAVQILAFDFDEDTTRLIADGKVRATVGQDPYLMGYISMILAHAARHALKLPSKRDAAWRMTALTEFLDTHPDIPKNTRSKLFRVLAALKDASALTPPLIDTGVEILGKDELLHLLARNIAEMQDSIHTKIAALHEEITEREQMEEKLIKERNLLQTVIEHSSDQIYVKDSQSRFLIANAAVVHLAGAKSLDELVGKTDFDFHPKKLAEQYYADEQALLKSGEPLINREERIVDHETGKTRWNWTNKVPFRDSQGNIAGFVGLNRDITDRKQAEEALQKANAELEERTAELAQANSEIRTLNEQLKEENIRMSAELDVARRLQEIILPRPEELQQIREVEIVGAMQPADEVGGDYYDVLTDNGLIHIGIGDVTGHGLESGILMLMTQTAVLSLIEHGETDPVAFLTTLNRILYRNIQRMQVDRMLTFAFMNYHQRQVTIVGQHEEVLIVRKNGRVERVDTQELGFPLGLEQDIAEWVATATITLEAGDGVVVYTDGITEAQNAKEEFYGVARLCEVISQHWDKSAEEIKQAVFDDVTGYIGRQKVYDDLTLLVLKQK